MQTGTGKIAEQGQKLPGDKPSYLAKNENLTDIRVFVHNMACLKTVGGERSLHSMNNTLLVEVYADTTFIVSNLALTINIKNAHTLWPCS